MSFSVDVVTLGSSILSLLCFVSLFVSSKPVTIGGVFMTIVLAASLTQVICGVLSLVSLAELPPKTPDDPEDVLEKARVFWDWASKSLSSQSHVEL